MKTRMWSGLAVIATCLCIPFFCITFILVAVDYTEARKKVAWTYFNSLELPLAAKGTHELESMLSNLDRFKAGFAALKVSNEHGAVLDRVEQIHRDASVLKDRQEELDQDAYQSELARLRYSVSLVPRIGERTFLENNPWLSGLITYAWTECFLGVTCSFVAFLVVFTGLAVMWCYSFDESGEERKSTDSKNNDSGSGGGGGYYGGGGGGGGYGGCGGGSPYYGGYYPGEYTPPTSHYPHFGGGNNGFPPWGSL